MAFLVCMPISNRKTWLRQLVTNTCSLSRIAIPTQSYITTNDRGSGVKGVNGAIRIYSLALLQKDKLIWSSPNEFTQEGWIWMILVHFRYFLIPIHSGAQNMKNIVCAWYLWIRPLSKDLLQAGTPASQWPTSHDRLFAIKYNGFSMICLQASLQCLFKGIVVFLEKPLSGIIHDDQCRHGINAEKAVWSERGCDDGSNMANGWLQSNVDQSAERYLERTTAFLAGRDGMAAVNILVAFDKVFL